MELAVILYTISNDNLRDNFSAELIKQGFIKESDQSTFTYPMSKVGQTFRASKFMDWLKGWANGREWVKGDFVTVYYLSKISEKADFCGIKCANFKIK